MKSIIHGRLIFGLLFLFLALGSFADGRYIPVYDDGIRVDYKHYCLGFNKEHKQANWVYYELGSANLTGKASRKNDFRVDPKISRWSATPDDYKRSGYDRGHLLPSADRDDTPSENRATFYLSNVSPQCAGLNRQIWRLLEEQVRRWAAAYDSLYVVTGPELVPGLPRIKGGVGVPRRYFKALLVWHGGRYHAIAFLIPNRERVEGGFGDYALSVNDLERQLGYDLFWRLPDSIEERVEGDLDRTFWK